MQNFSSSNINLSCPDPCSDTHRSLHRRLLSTLPWFPRAFFQQHAVQRLNPSVIFKLRRAESRSFPASPFNQQNIHLSHLTFSKLANFLTTFSYHFYYLFFCFSSLKFQLKFPSKYYWHYLILMKELFHNWSAIILVRFATFHTLHHSPETV